jgi:para-nitrobenzyl esterase
MRRARAALVDFLLCLNAAVAAVTVRTSRGVVEGSLDQNVSAFYAVPFAAPPTGKLRFQPPVAHGPWNGTLDCSAPPKESMCPQQLLLSGVPLFKGSEDYCLTLSVYAPAAAKAGDALPVMVWLPGGGFIEGGEIGGGQYNGSTFVQASAGEVIVVSIQYRVGSLGFLYSPDGADVHGNLGLLDQRLGMEWVAREIGANS